MNLNPAALKKTAAAWAIIFALLGARPSARAQTPVATNALSFSNGGEVGLNLPDLPPPWTAEVWVLRSDAAGTSAVLFTSPTAGLKLEQFGSANRNVGVTAYGAADYSFNYTEPTNTWTHLAFTCDGTNTALHVNGVQTDSLPISPSLPLTQFGSLTTDLLNATVDEISVWNYARSASQIKSTYQFPTAAPQSGLVVLWRCDDGKVPDSSGNHNNGSLQNASLVRSTAPIYLQTLVVGPGKVGGGTGTPLSLPHAVSIANGIGNMIIHFDPVLAGANVSVHPEMDITNDLTIDGSGLSSPPTFFTPGNRHFVIISGVNVTIFGINLTNGLAHEVYPANSFGGSISNAGNLTLNNVVFTQNQSVGADATGAGNGAGAGGGAVYNSGTLTLNQCTFTNNRVSGGAGSAEVIFGSANGGSARGAAIFNNGMLTANLSSFYSQTAAGGSAFQGSVNDTSISGPALGGAICNINSGVAVLNECTLANNTLVVQGSANTIGNAFGGAIYSAGHLTVNQSTMASNSFIGPGGFQPAGGSIYAVSNAIVSENIPAIIFNSVLGPDGAPQHLGPYMSTGVNLIDAPNAMLAPLDNYGGPTLTMPLMAGSPGINAGDDSASNMFATDQRGFPRLFGAHVDIGAVESMPPSFVFGDRVTSATVISTNTASGTYTVQFSAQYFPNGGPSTVTFRYGPLSYNGSNSVNVPGYMTSANGTVNVNLGRNLLIHWDAVLANLMGSITLADKTLFLPPFPTDIAGDVDGDGVVSQHELNQAYSNYLSANPSLLITNATGLGQSNVDFAVSNGLAGTYTVQSSTNLTDWTNLGPALPLYHFTDTNAPSAPQRYYRLAYP